MAETSVRLHPEAEQEASAARDWYAERSSKAAEAFLVELDRAMSIISEAPTRWPRVYRRYRRFPMHTFPFNVVYIERRGFVEVVAIAHFRRRPRYWRSR